MLVLVADDSGVVRSVIKRALTELGVTKIDEASDGKEAIDLVTENRYDLIVTDWNMPQFTGLEVIKTARQSGHTCPIILQTTEADRTKVMHAIAAGINDYVLKPFTREEIRDKLERHVIVARESIAAAFAIAHIE